MSQLINHQTFARVTHLSKYKLTRIAGPLMRITGIDQINRLYAHNLQYQGLDFVEGILQELNIRYWIPANETDRIPQHGPFIAISNHPFGLADGLVLLHMLGKRRPEIKLMANFLLQHILPIQEHFISVNPFSDKEISYSSLSGMRNALLHLQSGNPLAIFPSGEVSSFRPAERSVADPEWQLPVIKLIRKAQVPVIPIFFEGRNSNMFQIMGMVHPKLRTISLPGELLKKRQSEIRLRIGNPIRPKEQNHFQDHDQLRRYLRARTYVMGSYAKTGQVFSIPLKISFPARAIVPPAPRQGILREIHQLRNDQAVLGKRDHFEVFLTTAQGIPNILNEIGRLREISFREVGEGTNRQTDLDAYDAYYQHLFLWDLEAQQIAGAYRLGEGANIMKERGKKGFYLHSLFKIKDEFSPVLACALELGRSFVVPAYQRKRLPLFLLWNGISQFLSENKIYKHVMGPVSISNQYSRLSRSFMVAFLKKYYYDHDKARYIKARKKFQPRFRHLDIDCILEGTSRDLKLIDKVIADLEPSHFRLPVLLKKYIHQNARVIGFNLDPAFNQSLDSFMIMHTAHLPSSGFQPFRTFSQ